MSICIIKLLRTIQYDQSTIENFITVKGDHVAYIILISKCGTELVRQKNESKMDYCVNNLAGV